MTYIIINTYIILLLLLQLCEKIDRRFCFTVTCTFHNSKLNGIKYKFLKKIKKILPTVDKNIYVRDYLLYRYNNNSNNIIYACGIDSYFVFETEKTHTHVSIVNAIHSTVTVNRMLCYLYIIQNYANFVSTIGLADTILPFDTLLYAVVHTDSESKSNIICKQENNIIILLTICWRFPIHYANDLSCDTTVIKKKKKTFKKSSYLY